MGLVLQEADSTVELDRTVAVVGGGIAGITAAVKLFQQGYNVTLFEKAEVLGGSFSSSSLDNNGEPQEVYPHIIGGWYKEFWHLLENDLALPLPEIFDRRDRIKMAIVSDEPMESFADIEFAELATPTSLGNLFENLRSGVLPVSDMALFGYTYLDLISVPRRDQPYAMLDALDVTGFLYSRPFMNEQIAQLHDSILRVIWSIPSNRTSAKAYQDLLRHTLTFPNETPFAWLVKGPVHKLLMEPIARKLRKAFARDRKSALKLNTKVTHIDVAENDTHVMLTYDEPPQRGAAGGERRQAFRYVVMATPCKTALELAFSGQRDSRLISRAPILARFRESQTARIPVVYLYFTADFLARQGKALTTLPDELIGFKSLRAEDPDPSTPDSNDYDISIIDIARLWKREDLKGVREREPVFVLAASRCDAIEELGPGEGNDSGESQGFAMIKKLNEYLPFIDPGSAWGKGGDIDWDRTSVVTNEKFQLFLNDAGTEAWRPGARIEGLSNVFFAGDYCLTEVNMATVEAATQSGVLAAQAVQAAEGYGYAIVLQPHDLYANSVVLLVKLCVMPMSFGLAVLGLCDDARTSLVKAVSLPLAVTVRGAAYGSDWVRSLVQLGQSFFSQREMSPSGAKSYQSVAEHDRRIGLVRWAFNVAWSVLTEGRWLAPEIANTVGASFNERWREFTGAAEEAASGSRRRRPHPRHGGVWPPPIGLQAPQRKVADTAKRARPPKGFGNGTWYSGGGFGTSSALKFILDTPQPNAKSVAASAAGLRAAATTAVRYLGTALSTPSHAPVASFSDALRNAVRTGATTRRNKEHGYRADGQMRSLHDGE